MLDSDSQPERRTALIAKELARYTIDVAALQETRLGGQGQIQESTHTFFWIGKTAGRLDVGVAFAISNNIAGKLSSLPRGISERLMHLRIPLAKERFLSVINVYAPTMTYTDEEKEGFYEELAAVVDAVPASDKLLILGDFNARVGKDYRTHRGVLGKFGKGNMNSNGELLLNESCASLTASSINRTRTFTPGCTWMHLDDDMTGRVSIGGDVSDPFPINHGVKQGCVLAPNLFMLYLAAVLETKSVNLSKGVYIRTPSDGKLFNLARLRAKTRVRTVCVRELLYADDSALVATNPGDMQEIVDRFHAAATLFGLKINTIKTELLFQPNTNCTQNAAITVNGNALKCSQLHLLG